MSGLKFDDFVPAVISQKTHSIIDYIHAGTNLVAAVIFYKRGNSRAGHAAAALGASVLMNTLMTDYEYGVFASGVSRRTGYLIMEWRPQAQHSLRYWISQARLRRHTSTHKVAEKQRSRACRTTTTIPVRDISSGR